ncbi:MAG: 3-hydroxy-3-methylglutaryl-CoA lyase [Lachnospiraceae bacterium]|nr:3-hydroxy-3-methylglutaryl-CoA lyase [Lachnospiraceae bacterium]MBD5483073.1 3-hydroxy-3-methylglutaryl-CoA lyase [Lachnospiraceae bacterium]
MPMIKLLDCTLRDGGYINDWEFGNSNLVNIFERLVSAGIDIVEVGFLDERRAYDENRSIFPDTDAITKTYGLLDKGQSLIVGMIDYGTCGISHVKPCSEGFLDGIRVIFKKQKMHEAIAFCHQIKQLGYKVFAQAVSITSYDDGEFQELLSLINELTPYAFSLVDTYGLLHKHKLMHYYNAAEQKLKKEIGIGYHAHNNFQLAYANCVELLENPPKDRLLLVDGSLYGMGKSAGNTPIELLAMYMNENGEKQYHSSQLLEAIDVTILDIYRKSPWGYNFKFFIAASHDCHPSYVSYLMDKQKLSVKSVHEILDMLEGEKKLLYDGTYAEALYVEYQKRVSGSEQDMAERLGELLGGKKVLMLGPGRNAVTEDYKVYEYMGRNRPVVIAVNCMPADYPVDYLFISSARRYVQLSCVISRMPKEVGLIATSNVTKTNGSFDYTLSYNELLDEEAWIVDNPMIMMIRLLSRYGVEQIALAGFDGYTTSPTSDYANPNMAHSFSTQKAQSLNADVESSLARIPNLAKLLFVTTTCYHIPEGN